MARQYTSKAFPGTPDELAEALADPAKAAKMLGGTRAEWIEFQNRYAAAAGAADPGIQDQVQAEVAKWLKANPVGNMQRLNLAGAAASSSAPGAAADALFSGQDREHLAGKFFAAVSPKSRNPELAQSLRVENFSSTTPSEGGFLVPETLRSEILMTSLEQSIVRPRATVIPMSTARVPVPSVDDTTHSGSVLGGLTGAWVEEGAEFVADDAKFGRVVLDARKLGIYCEVPNELLNDAPALTAFLKVALPSATSFYEDSAFIRGTGTGEPLGFLNAPAAVSVAKETSQTADTIVWENIVKMYSRMLPGSLNRAVWVAHIDTFPELATMGLNVGTGGGPIWIGWGNGSGGADAPPMTILGRPVIFTEKAETVGDAGDISFVDLGYYLVGDRQQMTLTSSEHVKFQSDKTAFRIIERADGRLWLQSAITPAKGSNTLSPVVKIAARA